MYPFTGRKSAIRIALHFLKLIQGNVFAMPTVRVRDNENFELSLRRFKRLCEKAGILSDLRRHEFYEKPTWKRKRKAAAAVKRYQKKILRENLALERDRQPIGVSRKESA
tara:strand:- start:1909 stop:2238 length:330 start_codon:yes stop_codon:yes gene_type:complete